jgi:5-methylcytosine-specific restriction enzyme subunit McrC
VTGPSSLTLEEYKVGRAHLTVDQANRLREVASHRVSVSPTGEPDIWTIGAGSHVGTVVVPGFRLLIRPKVSTENLFHLLEAGGHTVPTRPEVFDYEARGDLVTAFATFFARTVERVLTAGIHRDYQEQPERLMGVRGRVDLHANLQSAGLALPLACRFDEFTADTPLNRVLRAAAVRLLRLPGVTPTTRQTLSSLVGRLEDAGALQPDELLRPSTFSRLNTHYRPADRLARLVLNGSSLVDRAGDNAACSFLVDMNVIFERFVADRLTCYLRGELAVTAQNHQALDEVGEVGMRPDLVFGPVNAPTYVGDTKYKISDGRGRDSDYYQLLAYTTALRLPEGLLIYCHSEGKAVPREITVRNAGTRLWSVALPLGGRPADVEAELQKLASWIEHRVSIAASGG